MIVAVQLPPAATLRHAKLGAGEKSALREPPLTPRRFVKAPLLVNVTVCDTDLPIGTLAKSILAGLTATGGTPTPVSEMLGPDAEKIAKNAYVPTEPLSLPTTLGVKVMVAVQLPPDGTLAQAL